MGRKQYRIFMAVILTCIRLLARPVLAFFFSSASTFGVWPLTLPARAKEPWTLPPRSPAWVQMVEFGAIPTCSKVKPAWIGAERTSPDGTWYFLLKFRIIRTSESLWATYHVQKFIGSFDIDDGFVESNLHDAIFGRLSEISQNLSGLINWWVRELFHMCYRQWHTVAINALYSIIISLSCLEMIVIDGWIDVTFIAQPIQNFLKFVFAHWK